MDKAAGAADIVTRQLKVVGDRVKYRCFVFEEDGDFTAVNPEFWIISVAQTPLDAAQGVGEGIIEHLHFLRMSGLLGNVTEEIPAMSLCDRIKWRADCAAEKLMSFLFRRDASLSLVKMDEPFSWVDEQYAQEGLESGSAPLRSCCDGSVPVGYVNTNIA